MESLSPDSVAGTAPQLVVVDDDEPGAVAADREPVQLRGEFGALALARSKCSRVGRSEVSAGLANVSPSAPEIGQRSQTRPPPLTGYSEEYLDGGHRERR